MFRCRWKVEKLGGPQMWGSTESPTPKFFFAKMHFFEWAFEKNAFLGNFFLGGGLPPPPKFFLFRKQSFWTQMFFSKVRRIFWAKNLIFFQKWGFSGFLPHRHIPAIFEHRSTKFWCQVALPEGFPKGSKYVDQSLSVSRKWGFSDFRPPRHISTIAAADLDKICTLCSDVEEKLKN